MRFYSVHLADVLDFTSHVPFLRVGDVEICFGALGCADWCAAKSSRVWQVVGWLWNPAPAGFGITLEEFVVGCHWG